MNPEEIANLEKLGDEQVFMRIAQGGYGAKGSTRRDEVEAWLSAKAIAAASDSSFKRDAREDKTLRLASRANLIAWIAAIMAAMSIIKDIVKDILM
jgi:hypothetical protein